jgi:hypothetical protein
MGAVYDYSGDFPLSPRQAAAHTNTTPATDHRISKFRQLSVIDLMGVTVSPAFP